MIQHVVCHGQLNPQWLMLCTVVFWFSIKSMQIILGHIYTCWIESYFKSEKSLNIEKKLFGNTYYRYIFEIFKTKKSFVVFFISLKGENEYKGAAIKSYKTFLETAYIYMRCDLTKFISLINFMIVAEKIK